jgi:hypothetical protein
VPQIAFVEALSEIGRQSFSQSRKPLRAVLGPSRSALFELDDVPTDTPASSYLNDIGFP